MYHSLYDMTPFRPVVMALLSVRGWATLEILLSIIVFFLTFAQKQFDMSQSTGGFVGILSYIALVWKAGVSFWVMLDGVYLLQHTATEEGRPIAVVLIFTIALQQMRQLLFGWAARQVVRSGRAAPLMFDNPEWVRMPTWPHWLRRG